MRLSYAVFIFLRSVRETPGCTPQQRIVFERYQRRCVEEIQVLADTASRTLDMLPDAPSDDLLDRRKLQWMNWMASFPELKSHQKQHKLHGTLVTETLPKINPDLGEMERTKETTTFSSPDNDVNIFGEIFEE
ncbi:hypothetical protein PDIDSM_6262 [Penicillium digitatum]|nr:hypothetical protein PDIDSM_6262 [Penicillium digitatum]